MSRVRPVLRSQRHGIKARILACTAMVACVVAALPAAASAAPSLSLSIDPAVPGIGKAFEATAKGVSEAPPNDYGPGTSYLQVFLNVAREPCAPTSKLEEAKSSAGGKTFYDGGGTYIPNGPFERHNMDFTKWVSPWADFNGLKTGRFRFCGYLSDNEANLDGSKPPLVATRLDFTVRKNCANARADAFSAAQTLKNEKKALKYTLKRTGRRYHKRARSRVKKAKRALKRARRVRKALC